MHRLIAGTTLAVLIVFQVNAASSEAAAQGAAPVFAQINDLVISQPEFEAIFQAAVRHRYYHGRVPADELALFRIQVRDDLITQTLVYDQAQQLGLQPDREKIRRGVEDFDRKNATNPDWKTRREQIIPRLIERLERQDLIERMEASIRDLPAPEWSAARQYYLDNPDKFTEPERLRLAVILLRVPPAASEDAWLQAERRLVEFERRLANGETFAALAQQYSEHSSASAGGDLGYLHRGVLEARVQQQVDRLRPGQLGEPIRLLEGVALFQLNGMQPAQLKPFVEVRERSRELLHRDLRDAAWNDYIATLRSSAKVYVNE